VTLSGRPAAKLVMSDATTTAGVDCPDVPNDTQWNEMLQRELLGGKDGESVCMEKRERSRHTIGW